MLDRQWRIQEEHKVREAIWTREDKRDETMQKREDKRDTDASTRHWREIIVFGGLIGGLMFVGSIIEAGWIPNPANVLPSWVWEGIGNLLGLFFVLVLFSS